MNKEKNQIVAFHVDMNMAQFNGDYLRKWLKKLKQYGYNAILWEVENNIEWEICQAANSPDAFSKMEFKKILNLAKELGFQNIPLLQILGHAQYVLKHKEYSHLRELPDEISQYCPSNPELIPFLKKWIDEYLELFDSSKMLHLGADEARFLGKCPACAKKVAEKSVSALYIDHVQKIADYVLKKNTSPCIWADMLLAHPEAMEKLSREVVIFDWNYHQNNSSETIRMWGRYPDITKDELNEDEIKRFGKQLFPNGKDASWNPFYCTDFLIANGFKTLTCSASSACGETVFCPNDSLHLPNVMDFSKKGESKCLGTVLTSWSVHLHPWEMQMASIRIPGYVKEFPESSLDEYKKWFAKETFGLEDQRFWEASELLEKYCFMGGKGHRGFGKDCLPVNLNAVSEYALKELKENNDAEQELEKTVELLKGYKKAKELLLEFSSRIACGHEIIESWLRASDLLMANARAAICILQNELGMPPDNLENIIETLNSQKKMMHKVYMTQQKPTRAKQISEYMFDAVLHELKKIKQS